MKAYIENGELRTYSDFVEPTTPESERTKIDLAPLADHIQEIRPEISDYQMAESLAAMVLHKVMENTSAVLHKYYNPETASQHISNDTNHSEKTIDLDQ